MKVNSARLFGIFFALSFVSYAIGTDLMEILENIHTQPNEVIESKVSLISGAILISIIHTVFNLGLLIVMFNVLKTVNPGLSIVYLVSGVFGTFMLAVGAVFLLLPIPLSETFILTNHLEMSDFSLILSSSSNGNFYSYQIGMIIWGLGGLVLCYLLHKSKLVPVLFPIWGYIGYLIFVAGCVLELFGKPYELMLSMLGGLFEIGLSVWLIVKGFNKVGVITAKAND